MRNREYAYSRVHWPLHLVFWTDLMTLFAVVGCPNEGAALVANRGDGWRWMTSGHIWSKVRDLHGSIEVFGLERTPWRRRGDARVRSGLWSLAPLPTARRGSTHTCTHRATFVVPEESVRSYRSTRSKRPRPPCDIPSGCGFVTGPWSHAFFPSRAASGQCVLTAAAAGIPAPPPSYKPHSTKPPYAFHSAPISPIHPRIPPRAPYVVGRLSDPRTHPPTGPELTHPPPSPPPLQRGCLLPHDAPTTQAELQTARPPSQVRAARCPSRNTQDCSAPLRVRSPGAPTFPH